MSSALRHSSIFFLEKKIILQKISFDCVDLLDLLACGWPTFSELNEPFKKTFKCRNVFVSFMGTDEAWNQIFLCFSYVQHEPC